MDAAIALLYELCVGSSNMEGVSILLSWLNHIVVYSPASSPTTRNLTTTNHQQEQQSAQSSAASVNSGVSAEVLHCIAAVLWNTPHDATTLVTDDLFRYFNQNFNVAFCSSLMKNSNDRFTRTPPLSGTEVLEDLLTVFLQVVDSCLRMRYPEVQLSLLLLCCKISCRLLGLRTVV